MKCIKLKSILNKTKPAFMAVIFSILGSSTLLAQAAEKTPLASSSVSTNTMLSVVAGALLFVIVLLSFTLSSAMDYYKLKKSKAASMILLAILTFFSTSTAFGQAAVAPAPASTSNGDGFLFYILIAIIVIEVGVILYFLKLFSDLTGINEVSASGEKQTWWDKINAFKPMDKEASLDMGHSYDGIRELDNITPPWFTATFLASILFAVVYLYRYHVAHSAPLSAEEYEISVKDAQAKVDAFMKTSGSAIDENNVKMADATGIADGKGIYTTNCIVCHGDKGQGIVGPNLTDDYWIHGCSMSDIYKTVYHGVVDKGMTEWGKMLTPTQIQNVASYVKSLHGTNPAGAKDKQGTECSDSGAPVAASGADKAAEPAKDSVTAAK